MTLGVLEKDCINIPVHGKVNSLICIIQYYYFNLTFYQNTLNFTAFELHSYQNMPISIEIYLTLYQNTLYSTALEKKYYIPSFSAFELHSYQNMPISIEIYLTLYQNTLHSTALEKNILYSIIFCI